MRNSRNGNTTTRRNGRGRLWTKSPGLGFWEDKRMKDMWEALLESEPSLKQATNVRVSRGKGTIAGSRLIPGPVTIEFDLPEGVAPPGQGIITTSPAKSQRLPNSRGSSGSRPRRKRIFDRPMNSP